jgi:hypothetical protein
VYPASYAALPLLRTLAEQWGPDALCHPLLLAAAIAVSDDGPLPPAEVRQQYAGDLAGLHRLTERSLELLDLRSDPTAFVYLLQALRAFEGDDLWGAGAGPARQRRVRARLPGVRASTRWWSTTAASRCR